MASSEPAPLVATFTCKAKGYESKVDIDLHQYNAADALTDWLEWQGKYLQAINPGDTVQARGDLSKKQQPKGTK